MITVKAAFRMYIREATCCFTFDEQSGGYLITDVYTHAQWFATPHLRTWKFELVREMD